jgi:spermidine synthase
VAAALVLMGFVATSAQVLLIRRLMSALYGNELVVGLVLAVWMVGTASGSLLAARAPEADPKVLLGWISTAIAVLTPASVLGTYGIKAALGVHRAAALGPGHSALVCSALLFPLTFLLGAAFVYFSTVDRSAKEERIGAVYLLEALGAAFGGLACGIAASVGLPPFDWAFGVALGAGVMAWLIAPRGLSVRLPAAIVLLAAAVLTRGPWSVLPEAAESLEWPGYEVLETVETRYASIAVVSGGGQRTVYLDGLPDFTWPDKRGAEEVIHTALLQHPNPRRVLLIGGGLTEAGKEALKHGPDRLDYVQLDPEITRVEKDHFGDEADRIMSDPRVSVHNVDGRVFAAAAGEGVYDVVILNAPDPATALINRFYTAEFFGAAKSLLAPRSGVFAFGCGEVANYVSRSQGRLLGSLAATLASVFDHQVVLPLGRVYFVASDTGDHLTAEGGEPARRLRARGIETEFMRDYYLSYDLSDERVAYLTDEIAGFAASERTEINRDRNPVGYFYYLIYWYGLLGSPMAGVLEGPWSRHGRLLIPIAALVVLAGTAVSGRRAKRRGAVSLAVFAMGFATLASQVVLLLAFQTFQGYLFHSVGMIVAAFMVGLSLGALWLRRRSSWPKLWPIQTGLSAYCAIVALLLFLPLQAVAGNLLTALAISVSLGGGVLGGALFQGAVAAVGAHDGREVGRAAGLLNACDHLGAALGALGAASLALPVLGMAGTAALAAAATGGSALGLALSKT